MMQNSLEFLNPEDIRWHLEAAQRVGGFGSWETDLVDGWIFWSPGVFEIFGWDPSIDVTFERLLMAVHPDDRVKFMVARQESIAGRRPYSLDYRIVRPDGSVRRLHSQAHVDRDAAGVATGLLGVIADQTERIEAAEEHHQREQRRHELVVALMTSTTAARRALARDLHDGAIQRLTLAALELEAGADPELADTALRLHRLVEDLRSKLVELDPASLVAASGTRALERLIESTMAGVPTELEVVDEEHMATTVYELVADALGSARQLAATEVRVEIIPASAAPVTELRIDADLASAHRDQEGSRESDGRIGRLLFEHRARAAGGSATATADATSLRFRARIPSTGEST